MEWKELKEIFDTRNGYTPSTSNETFWEGGTIPWFKMEDIRDNGSILNDSYLHITDKAIKGKGLFKANSLLLATSATIGEHALIEVEHLSNQRFTNFYPKKGYENRINMRYAYYYMYIIDEWCKQHINQGGFASVDMGGLYKLPFPIPPLSDQQRIVEQLDTFTSSIENLKEQIAQRRKQYEYYRDQLLDLEGKEEKDIHSWGEFCEMIKGNGVQKVDFVDEGVGCIHYGQIYTHYGPYTYETNKFVSKEVFEKARKASKGDIVMTDTSENVEDICKSVAYLGENEIAVSNHALIIKHQQNPKFLSFSTQTNSFLVQKRKYVVGAKVSGIKPDHLAQIKIYLPSLDEQQRIVSILDTFEVSINNLEQQLAQRERQYEYYRNKLLTFELYE